MKYLIVAILALATPIFARPQVPQQPQTQPQIQHQTQPQTQHQIQPQPQPLAQRSQVGAQQPQTNVHSGSGVTPVSIVSQTEEVGPDGSFNYSFDTSDGVHVEQGGYVKQAAEARSVDPNNPDAGNGEIQVIQGAYSYTAPDGQQISLRYIADENGFQPEGQHLPTTPPVPEGIARSLEQQPQQQEQQGQQGQAFHQQSQQNIQQRGQVQGLSQQTQQHSQIGEQQPQVGVGANPSPVTQG